MRSDVHSAALRAAAKVAFSVAFLAGCSSAESTEATDENGNNADGTQAASTESDIKSGKTPACHHDSGAPKLTCDQIVAAAFPTEGNYPGKKQAVSLEVQNCCEELLSKNHGLTAHRWDCCANLPADAGNGVGIACTPWGPPVPPAMKSRRSRVQLQLEVA
jgi:hypothetical protein